ncbi:MAG: hypothetical protein LUD47_07555 [Clostridia bacterium]|nr:hypothetical protein [Clostridia bacterium]
MQEHNWDRQYRLTATVQNDDGTYDGFTIGQQAEDGRAIHISFSVQRTDEITYNSAKMNIWNLSQAHIDILTKVNCSLQLCAGYGDSRPVVFSGTVTNLSKQRDGADWNIEIECVDCFLETTQTTLAVSYAAGVSAYQILSDVSNRIGTPVTYSANAQLKLEQKKFGNGYVHIGYAEDILTEICDGTDVSWSLQNGVLQVMYSNEGIDTYIFLLNEETGLTGTPKRVYNSAVNSTDTGSLQDTLYGYEITYFMNGAIGVGSLIMLETNIARGIYFVSDLQITGDNISGDWQCTATVEEATWTDDYTTQSEG